MKRLLGIIWLFSILLGNAQDKVQEYIVKITYDKIVWSSNVGNFDTYLYADDTKSQFIFHKKTSRLITEEGYTLTSEEHKYINNYDFESKKVEDNRILSDGTILYATWDNDLEWEITDEEKMISEYKVRKAITKSFEIEDDDKWYQGNAYAWFTTDLPIPAGPGRYYGLAGLILELKYDKGSMGSKTKYLK